MIFRYIIIIIFVKSLIIISHFSSYVYLIKDNNKCINKILKEKILLIIIAPC